MEEIGELIGKGFGVWRQNLNLCIPFLLSFVLSSLLLILVLAVLAVAFVSLQGINSTSFQDAQDAQVLLSQMEEAAASLSPSEAGSILLVTFLLLLLLILISSFFTAGAIGMAKQALEAGRADAGAMWSAGREHFRSMFLATIAMGLLVFAGLVFLIPGVALLYWSTQPDAQAVGILAAGFLLLAVYAIALSLLLAEAPYALVVDRLGALAAISASARFFWYNKFDVLVLWLIVVAVSLGLQMAGGSLSVNESLSYQPASLITGLINILILAPLSNLWWTRLYMSRKGLLLADDARDPW